MKLKDKVAIVTGAGSGLGLGIAKTFAKQGAKVAIADFNTDNANQACEQLQQAGFVAQAVIMDVSSETEVERGIAKVISSWGQVDILVSNAGIQHIEPVHEIKFETWRKVLGVHLDGAFLTTRACLRQMYQQPQGGTILYMGSVHSKLASPLKSPYVTGKHGIVGLCRTVAREGAAHKVRANIICPGFVKTPLVEKQIPEIAKESGMTEEEVVKKVMLKDTIDGEFTTVDDIAETALFLAAHPTTALSGQSIVVSHGWYCN